MRDLKSFENSQPSASHFKSISGSQEQFFLTAGQNNFWYKLPTYYCYILCTNRHASWYLDRIHYSSKHKDYHVVKQKISTEFYQTVSCQKAKLCIVGIFCFVCFPTAIISLQPVAVFSLMNFVFCQTVHSAAFWQNSNLVTIGFS